MKTRRTTTLSDVEKDIKRAHRNMIRQRNRTMAIQGTGRDIRVRPEFWEQVKSDHMKLRHRLLTHTCRQEEKEPEYNLAPIVGARCVHCNQPI